MTEMLEKRERELAAWLRETAPECFSEQRHAVEGTQERVYWHHGYMSALRDARGWILGATLQPRGCVCPVGAEATCKGLACPRRSFGVAP